MRRTTLVSLMLVVLAGSGCAKIKEFLDRKRGRRPAAAQQQTPQPADSQKAGAPAGPGQRPAGPPVAARPIPQGPTPPARDLPYNPRDTGTIAPGMSERDVYTLWGPAEMVRRQGEFTYMFFRNGCEYSCGMHDLVILQNDQVVDAITRHPGHGYSGVSSSPPGRKPVPNRGDTLQIPPQNP